MRLIPDPHKCFKFFSVQANIIGVALSGAYASLYENLKETIPPHWMATITGIVFALGIIGRIVSQQPKDEDESK